MTIWLLTLPEKFKMWYEVHLAMASDDTPTLEIKNFREVPSFPQFGSENVHTKLIPNINTNTFAFLPKTWELMKCFEYF